MSTRKKGTISTPIKSMRLKCLDCCVGSTMEVRLCPSVDCSLWLYRFGKRPTQAMIKEFLRRNGRSETKND